MHEPIFSCLDMDHYSEHLSQVFLLLVDASNQLQLVCEAEKLWLATSQIKYTYRQYE
jgi:hypothetical protein